MSLILARDVGCPHCKVAPDAPCRTPSGRTTKDHAARDKLAGLLNTAAIMVYLQWIIRHPHVISQIGRAMSKSLNGIMKARSE